MAPTRQIRKERSNQAPHTLQRLSLVFLALLLVGTAGCYKNEENKKEEKYEQKKQASDEAEKAVEKEAKEAEKEAPAADASPAKASLDSFAKAVSEAAQEGNSEFFEENLVDPEGFSGCKATGNAAADALGPDELKKRFETVDKKAAMESFEQDLTKFESEKLVKVFSEMKEPAHFHGELHAASDDATCKFVASATIETAAMIDHEDEDIVRHVTDVLYDGENWRVYGQQSIGVDCDEKPMAKTKSCQAYQAMEM